MDDRVDIHNHERQYERTKRQIELDSQMCPENKELILAYLRDSELGKTIKKGQKKKIGSGRNIRTAGILRMMDKKWFKKPFMDISVTDMEAFILKLDKGKILSEKGTPYKSESLKTIKKFIRKFWKYMKGNGQIYPPEVEWIDTSGDDAEISTIPDLRKGVERMADFSGSTLKRAIIMALFDSGAREGEFLNLRIKDVELKNETYYIRIRHSKTKARTVGLQIATPAIKEWLKEHPEPDNKEALLWEYSSNGKIKPVRKAYFYVNISRIAKKALGAHVTPQMFRHTSATYFCTRLDRTSFCNRFGWSYGSKMPDRYINFAAIEEGKTVDIIKNEDIGQLRDEQKELKEEVSRLKEQLQQTKLVADNDRFALLSSLQPERKHDLLGKAVAESGIPRKYHEEIFDYFRNSGIRYDNFAITFDENGYERLVSGIRKSFHSGRLFEAMEIWKQAQSNRNIAH